VLRLTLLDPPKNTSGRVYISRSTIGTVLAFPRRVRVQYCPCDQICYLRFRRSDLVFYWIFSHGKPYMFWKCKWDGIIRMCGMRHRVRVFRRRDSALRSREDVLDLIRDSQIFRSQLWTTSVAWRFSFFILILRNLDRIIQHYIMSISQCIVRQIFSLFRNKNLLCRTYKLLN